MIKQEDILEKSFQDIKEEFEKVKNERDEALNKVEEWNKDEEIQKLQEEKKELLKALSQGFVYTDKQWKNIRKWQKKHTEKMHKQNSKEGHLRKFNPGAPDYTYTFGYFNVGCLSSVVCETCQRRALKEIAEKNLDDNFTEKEKILKKYDVSYFVGEV